MAKITVNTSRPVVPMIYAYTTPEIARHDGWTKIGYTEQNVDERIPYGTPEEETKQLSLFDFMIEPEEKKETPVCRIYDWKANKSLLFTDLKD